MVQVPPGATAGGILDIWQRPLTDTGQTGPEKGQGAKFLVLPPGSEDMKPDGYIVIHSPTMQLWFATRGLDPDPKAAEETVRKHKLYAWSDRDNPPPTKFIPVAGRSWVSNQPDNLNYWKYLSDLYQPEPVEERDRIMFAMLLPLGIEPGKPFKPDARQSKILTDAAQVGELMARTNAFDKRMPGATVYPGKHWEYANMVELDQEAKNYTQLDQRGSWFYEASGRAQACRDVFWASGRSTSKHQRTSRAIISMAARHTACMLMPILQSNSSGPSRSTTTSRAVR